MKNWSKEQLEAYAAAFRDKDAVYVKGYGWDEVAQVQNDGDGYNCVPYSLGTTNVDKYINSWKMRDGRSWIGFPTDFEENCKIVTPKDYEVQEGDKLVWLGKTQKQGKHSEYTFGKVYEVERHGDRLIYKDDMTLSILARSEKDRWKFWGVIPKWENVKGDKKVMSDGFKFNVGDVVRTERLTGHRVGTVEYRDDDPEQEYIYHVRYDNEGCETKEFSMKWHKPEELTLVSGSFDEDVELVEAIDHTGKFKRGDRVRVVSAVLPAHVESIGKEGKIKGIWVNGLYRYTVQFDDGDVTLRNFNEVQLELIDEGFKFSVGDIVRIVEDDSLLPFEKEYIGSKAKVVEVDYDYTPFFEPYPYAVDIPDADDYVWLEENALELADKNTPSERSVEHQALDYLLNQGVGVKEELAKEVIEWAKYYLEELDFKEAKKAIDIAEQLVGEQ